VSWKPLREGINKSEYEEYKFLNNYYLQCLKVDFVYYEIVKVMKELPSLEQDRKNVEFMYLLVSRCFFEISQIKTLKELPNQLDQ
jgi:chaperonin cofactor prefoldin